MNVSAQRVLMPTKIHADGMAPQGQILCFAGACMGTRWEVRVVADEARQASGLQAGLLAVLEDIEAQMSHFRRESPLCHFATLPAGTWMTLPRAFAQVMRTALQVARDSDGAFDPAIGAAIDAWGFGAGPDFRETGFVPPVRVTSAAAWQRLRLDAQDRLLQPGGISLNLSAIAKGFAVDALSDWLATQGFTHCLVEIGGELRGVGMKPDLQPWWVALEAPADDCKLPVTRLALHGLAVATSGNYRRRYRFADSELQHTLDPRSGAPVTHRLASVTVVHEECILADAWATAIMVQGRRGGLALAERHALRALLQWRDATGRWQEAQSTAFLALQN